MFSALAEVRTSAANLEPIGAGRSDHIAHRALGITGILLAVSSAAKSTIAWVSGGKAYGLRVSIGLAIMLAGILATVMLSEILGK